MQARARPHTLPTLAALAALALWAAAGCGNDRAGTGTGANGEPAGTLVVFAAASLTDAFTELAREFEQVHSAVTVKLNFAGSQSLRTQILNGAQPQVFASANAVHMDSLRAKKLVGEPVIFVTNELVVVLPAANPAGIHSLEQLPNADRIVLALENVPAGAYAVQMLANASSAYGADFAARVNKQVVSREAHVRQTLQKVILGEADAAIVYATDAASAGAKVKVIEIPREHNVVASYPIATVVGTPRSALARLFVEYVVSDAGKARLQAHGFRAAELDRPTGQ